MVGISCYTMVKEDVLKNIFHRYYGYLFHKNSYKNKAIILNLTDKVNKGSLKHYFSSFQVP